MAHLVVVMLVSIFATVAHATRDGMEPMEEASGKSGGVKVHYDERIVESSDIEEAMEVKRMLPDIRRSWGDLYMHEHISIMHDSLSVYEGLLKSMAEKRAQTKSGVKVPGTLDELRANQIDYVEGLYTSLLCERPADAPAAFFVLGGMAVGKSTFIEDELKFPYRTVHVNHDDIRSLLVGNYEVFRKTKSLGEADRRMIIDDAKVVRSRVVSRAIAGKCNFIRDAFLVEANDVEEFVKAGYTVHVHYLEIGFKGSKFADTDHEGSVEEYFVKKAQLTQQRIQGRVDSGGHGTSSGIAPDAIAKIRSQVEELAKQLNKWSPPVPVNLHISQEGHCDYVGPLAMILNFRSTNF